MRAQVYVAQNKAKQREKASARKKVCGKYIFVRGLRVCELLTRRANAPIIRMYKKIPERRVVQRQVKAWTLFLYLCLVVFISVADDTRADRIIYA